MSASSRKAMNEKVPPKERTAPTPSKFVMAMRRVYRPLGFSKGYNFPLFLIFSGAMLGFCIARLSFLNVAGSAPSSFASSASPGEWYNYHAGHERIGITIHLATCIPCGLLMVWQFVPAIRRNALIFHRINGYIVISLASFANAGALMIARTSFGGHLEVQGAVGLLVILITLSLALAYYNIKRLQIEQHRAWMLRAAFLLGTIITVRLIMILSAVSITNLASYYQVNSCGQVAFQYGSESKFYSRYPACLNATAKTPIVVHANLKGAGPEEVGASLGLSFGLAMWLAIFLHLVGVETYLQLTPRESERLRNISYERQLEAGFQHPGSAGLTSDRFGDAARWEPLHLERC